MKKTDNKGIKNGNSNGGTIRAFRSPHASSKAGSNGERKLTSGRSADAAAEKAEAEVKRAEKTETVKKTAEPSPAPSGIKGAVAKRRGAETAKANKGKRNSWRRASEVYSRGSAKKGSENKDKKEKKAIPASVRRGVIAVLLILLTAAACVGIYYMSLVKTIYVNECEHYTRNDLINAAGIYTGKCILTYDTQAIKERLEQDPYLEVFSVKRVFPDEIRISVAERSEYAAIITGSETCCVIDRTGYVLSTGKRAELTGLKPVYGLGTMGYTIGTRIDSDKSLLRPYVLMELINAFGEREGEIDSIDLTIPASLKLTTTDGYTVMFGDSVDIEAKVARMFSALDTARAGGTDSRTIYINSSGSTDLGGESGSAPHATAEPTLAPTAEPTEEPAATETDNSETVTEEP